jgi:hypothetical protein
MTTKRELSPALTLAVLRARVGSAEGTPLLEGSDVPQRECVVVARPTASLSPQQSGRCARRMRPTPP